MWGTRISASRLSLFALQPGLLDVTVGHAGDVVGHGSWDAFGVGAGLMIGRE